MDFYFLQCTHSHTPPHPPHVLPLVVISGSSVTDGFETFHDFAPISSVAFQQNLQIITRKYTQFVNVSEWVNDTSSLTMRIVNEIKSWEISWTECFLCFFLFFYTNKNCSHKPLQFFTNVPLKPVELWPFSCSSSFLSCSSVWRWPSVSRPHPQTIIGHE